MPLLSILSIRVDEIRVILVGLLMEGIVPLLFFNCINDADSDEGSVFIKSIYKLPQKCSCVLVLNNSTFVFWALYLQHMSIFPFFFEAISPAMNSMH